MIKFRISDLFAPSKYIYIETIQRYDFFCRPHIFERYVKVFSGLYCEKKILAAFIGGGYDDDATKMNENKFNLIRTI